MVSVICHGLIVAVFTNCLYRLFEFKLTKTKKQEQNLIRQSYAICSGSNDNKNWCHYAMQTDNQWNIL